MEEPILGWVMIKGCVCVCDGCEGVCIFWQKLLVLACLDVAWCCGVECSKCCWWGTGRLWVLRLFGEFVWVMSFWGLSRIISFNSYVCIQFFYMHFVSFFNIFLSFIIVILYLCYNDGLVLHNLILVIILMLYIVFYPTRTCGRTMSVNIEHVLPCINKVIIIIIIIINTV